MGTRREFLKTVGGAATGIYFTGCAFLENAAAALEAGPASKRREVAVAGRRIKTVDIHAHCTVPEVWTLTKDYDWGGSPQVDNPKGMSLWNLPERLRVMRHRPGTPFQRGERAPSAGN